MGWETVIDISNWQPTLLGSLIQRIFPTSTLGKKAQIIDAAGTDWNAIRRAGVWGAIIKASEGSSYKDPAFALHYDRAKAVGMRLGCYHFLLRSTATPIQAQVDNFLAAIGPREMDFPLALDVERHPNYGNVTASDVKMFLTLLIGRTQKRPLLYTSPGYWAYLGNPAWGPDLADLWQAQYRYSLPQQMPYWARCKVWQFLSTARISGMNGYVDLNWYMGGLEGL